LRLAAVKGGQPFFWFFEVFVDKSEERRPKSERSPKSESGSMTVVAGNSLDTDAKTEVSSFGFLSDIGFQPSDLFTHRNPFGKRFKPVRSAQNGNFAQK
jgi:hypothetical protein